MQDETSILIDSVRDAEGSMDEKCHDIFLNKEILAPILKQTIEEYSDLTVEEIQSLIDEASISKVETVSEYPVSKDVKIKPLDTALKSVSDKTIYFDVFFKAALPKDKQTKASFQLYVDIEPQGAYYVGYPLTKRSIYYVARSLARQLGVLSCETDYGKLQKCYSIWICYGPKIPKKLKNTACRYSFTKEDIFGTVEEDESNYDLMEVVIVMLDTSADTDYKLLDYLKGVLTYNKEKIMEQAGQLSPQAEKEVEAMSGVGSMIRYLGVEEGIAKGRVQGENLFAKLILKLTSLGKNEDIAKCAADADYREKLYQLYDIKEENQN